MTCLIGKEQNIFNSAACEKPFQVYGRMRISSRWTGSSRLKTLPAHHCILWNSAAFQATMPLTVPLQRDISQAERAGELYQWQPKSFLYSQTSEAYSQACQRTVRSRMGTETGTCGSTRVFWTMSWRCRSEHTKKPSVSLLTAPGHLPAARLRLGGSKRGHL